MERIGDLYRLNFDYESDLFCNRPDNKVNEVFEHLFFFCCDRDDILLTQKKYNKEYLDFVKSATGFENKIESSGVATNWWGQLTNRTSEKELNSKLTSLKVSNTLECNSSKAYTVPSYKELVTRLKDLESVMIRSPFERSGRDNLVIESLDLLEKNKKRILKLLNSSPLIVEKYQSKRDFDLGSTFEESKDEFKLSFQIKNFNDGKGVFRGGLLLKENVGSPFLESIAHEYYKKGARRELQIDSFRFEGHWNWLCEANYRKTMGFIIKKLSRLCRVSHEVALLVTPISWLRKFKSHSELHRSLEEIDGVFPLSPVGSPIMFWLFSAQDRDELLKQALDWWSIVGAKERDFPVIFNNLIDD